MGIFQEVKLRWGDEEFVVAPDRIMPLLAKIEDVITIGELQRSVTQAKPPIAKLAMAFGIALRHAGAKVTDDEVYEGMFAEGELQVKVAQSVFSLLVLMIPPSKIVRRSDPKAKAPSTENATNSSSGPTA